jgi:hypothetical protein
MFADRRRAAPSVALDRFLLAYRPLAIHARKERSIHGARTRRVAAAAADADPGKATVSGKFIVEHPTLQNLGFEWRIEGDANRNAAVAVRFRPVGESAWRPALPLVRIGGENVYRRRRRRTTATRSTTRWISTFGSNRPARRWTRESRFPR